MKEDGLTALAKMFKTRENQSISSIGIGTVMSKSPLTVSFGNLSDLDTDDLVFAKGLEIGLKTGEELIIMPSSDEQTYFVLAKAVTL